MTRRIGIGAITLAAACLADTLLTTSAVAVDAKRPRDPWVFRSVLDGRARMLTCAMSDKLYVSYDTQTASLYRAWSGGVNFSGGVYDARHGPQPTSVGPAYYRRDRHDPTWTISIDGKPCNAKPRYLGYRTGRDDVTIELALDTPGGRVSVDERPSYELDADKVTLVRTFEVGGLPAGAVITLDLAGEKDDPMSGQAVQSGAVQKAGDAGWTLTIDHNGTTRLRTTWRTE